MSAKLHMGVAMAEMLRSRIYRDGDDYILLLPQALGIEAGQEFEVERIGDTIRMRLVSRIADNEA